MNKKTVVLFTALIFFTLPVAVQAAILRFDPSEGMYGAGDEFAVNLLIDINSGCVNTIEAEVLFPAERVQLKSVLTGDSVVSIWVDRPSDAELAGANEAGRLHLSGGIPGGYCGRIPGDPGDSNIVARIVFAVPAMTVAITVHGRSPIR